METTKTRQKLSFLEDYNSDVWSMAELCERYGISRPTGYLWVHRFIEEGEPGLQERPRRPEACPHKTAPAIEERILGLRKEHGWGAKKLLQYLGRHEPEITWPARSTINDILGRHGLLAKRRRRRKWDHPGAVPLVTDGPNQVWPVDFKGQFKTRDGIYCYPLTVTDHFSRKLLACTGLPSVRTEHAKPVFVRLFREYGLPDAIRSDNGPPFASTGIHGLCALNVWWMKLGIVHQRTHPGSPQENGQHERMHRELKKDTTNPPEKDMKRQQRRFNRYRAVYNQERPHEGIDGLVPNDLWTPSSKPYPSKLAGPAYAAHLEVRRVSEAGCFRLHAKQPFLSNALAQEDIALEEIGDGVWNIIYYETLLGRIDERTGLITGAKL